MPRKPELIEPHKGDKRYIRRDERAGASPNAMMWADRSRRTGGGKRRRWRSPDKVTKATGPAAAASSDQLCRTKRNLRDDQRGPA